MIQFNRRQFVLALLLLYNSVVVAQHAPATITLTIDANKTFQTIDNFGASDCWSGQFVGNWPDEKKNAMADWLFSLDTTANGDPKGIGLSMWRFNIGAGSSQQGGASGIRDEWRRAESFLETDGSYNWNRQSAQQWFLLAAKERGVRQFLAFYNSPPVQFTKNQKAFAVKGQCNIDPSKYDSLADYTVKVLEGIKKKTGILFDYLSPVNEPQWDWSDGGQEGCPYNNREISGLVRSMAATFKQHDLSTKIIIPEAGHIKYLLSDDDKPGKGNQVFDFMRPSSGSYVGNLSSVAPVMAAHSYFSTSPYRQSLLLRRQVAERIAAVKDLSFWQSEYCILGDNDGEIRGNKRDTGMQSALYLARTIHTDLAIANAAAWQWWIAISPYNYKDGLIYIDKNKTDGNYYDSKMLWALGNYSRFIKPGMQRIAVSAAGADSTCFVSAYKDANTHRMVIVLVNTGKAAQAVVVKTGVGAQTKDVGPMATYTTSVHRKLGKQNISGMVQVEPESIITIVIQ
jgi:O-glycosyl hydrolase